ncbi:MAG: hypothetical protein WCA46_17060, partial [Actinocatenispora sp.]
MNDTSAGPRSTTALPFGVTGMGDPRGPAVLLTVLGVAGVALLWPALAAFPDGSARVGDGWPQLVGGFALAGAGVAVSVLVTRLTRIAQS